ncbi:MAG: type II toxin-antitoxin system HicA family toxin [Verrucomicrobia bacterium]|nr:type II toxin-antitoxin system HicA family toxin [Verrucomicrobiota bacterium]
MFASLTLAVPHERRNHLYRRSPHHIMRRDDKTVVVPQHKPIKPGTHRGMLDQACVTLEAFTEAL